MTEEQQARLKRFLSGKSILAHIRKDRALIDLIKSEISPRAVEVIDRRGIWGNPYIMADESERDLVCDKYQAHFEQSGLSGRVEDLRRKVLCCWCYPRRCHGLTLLKALGDYEEPEETQNTPLEEGA